MENFVLKKLKINYFILNFITIFGNISIYEESLNMVILNRGVFLLVKMNVLFSRINTVNGNWKIH